MSDTPPKDFDLQAAWLRRFSSDAESNLKAFALRLKEAMPELVTLHERRPFLFGTPKLHGVSIELGERKYTLEIVGGRLKATVSMVVRRIALNTKSLDPADWFVQITEETQKSAEHAKSLSQSLAAFMSS